MPLPADPIQLATEAETVAFAERLAPLLGAGDTLLLSGPIGAGKSAFARALIRCRAGMEIDVPSPTYTLVQSYELGGLEIWHCDLYRLTDPDEVLELGLLEAMETALCLIEWPQRLGDLAPSRALRLEFSVETDGHTLRLSGSRHWADRLEALA